MNDGNSDSKKISGSKTFLVFNYLGQNKLRLDEHTCVYPLLSVSRENEDLPGHSQPPPLALLATAAAYDLASKISNL